MTICALIALNVSLMSSGGRAATPWGLIGSRVIGRVQQFTQQPQDNRPGFDVATVILNTDAAAVYSTAVGLLRRNQTVHIVTEDPRGRAVQFSNGMQSAGITVSDLGTRLSQIVVVSALNPGEPSATLRIVDGILNVCQAMKIKCNAQ
jgi:hypothetical protein